MKRVILAVKTALIAAMLSTMPAQAQRIVERGYELRHREVSESLRVQQGGPRMQYGHQYNTVSSGYIGLIAVNLSFGGGGQRMVRLEPVRTVSPGGCRLNIDTRMPLEVRQVEIPIAIENLCYQPAREHRLPVPRIYYNYY